MHWLTGAWGTALVVLASGVALADLGTTADVVAVRQDVMRQLDTKLAELEIAAGEGSLAPENLAEDGATIIALLGATPYLFPAESDLLTNPDGKTVTSAAPAIWTAPDDFAARAQAAIDAARLLVDASDAGVALTTLRNSCTACHDTFLQYQSPFGFGGAMAPAEPAQ